MRRYRKKVFHKQVLSKITFRCFYFKTITLQLHLLPYNKQSDSLRFTSLWKKNHINIRGIIMSCFTTIHNHCPPTVKDLSSRFTLILFYQRTAICLTMPSLVVFVNFLWTKKPMAMETCGLLEKNGRCTEQLLSCIEMHLALLSAKGSFFRKLQ
jgi:hypothetical protein